MQSVQQSEGISPFGKKFANELTKQMAKVLKTKAQKILEIENKANLRMLKRTSTIASKQLETMRRVSQLDYGITKTQSQVAEVFEDCMDSDKIMENEEQLLVFYAMNLTMLN